MIVEGSKDYKYQHHCNAGSSFEGVEEDARHMSILSALEHWAN
jgi:hypothetical protein